MRTLLASAVVVVCCAHAVANGQRAIVEFPVDRSVVDVDNEFNRNDPFYKQRAGAFYDYTYVAPSAEALVRIAQIQPEQMPGTLDALRAFVYEWLDAYVRGNGAVGRTEMANCIARLDERFDLLLDSPLQRKLYRVWRDDESNKLRFLMVSTATVETAAPSPRPDACKDLKVGGPSRSAEHVPYPPIGRPWPVEVSTATIVKNLLVAHPLFDHFPPVSVEQVREGFMRYLVVPRTEWEQGYSHVGLSDEGGWLVAGSRCFAWTMRPGGLASIAYPDGTAVYLAAPCPGQVGRSCTGAGR